MSSVKWTESQRDAINARGGSVLVSAAAGSGKTAVLVERIISAVTDETNPISLDRMLIVTFTRAASAEMRARIEKALSDKLAEDPYNKYLLNQRRLLYNARISTIDSFCIDFVRQYFFELNIQSDFRIADGGEKDILLNKAIDNTLEYFYKQNDKDFLSLVSSVCSYKNDNNLRKHLTNAYYFLTSVPFPKAWYNNTLSYYDEKKFEDTPYFEYFFELAGSSLSYSLDINMKAIEFVKKNECIPEEYADKYAKLLVDDSRILIDIYNSLEKRDWDKLRDSVRNTKFSSMPKVKKGVCDEEKEKISAFRDQYKKELKNIGNLMFLSIDDINSRTKKLYPVIKAFTDCLKKLNSELFALKSEKNVLDFSDVSQLMIKLLYNTESDKPTLTDTAREIASQFDAVMVDEFQDINEVQDYIFRAVSNEYENLFVVGDVKQSIYQFRQAKPEIFINYKDKYPTYSRSRDEYPSKIILKRNFRSSSGVCDAINFIFKTLMRKETGGIDYNDEEKLICGSSYPESENPAMELMLISSSDLNPEKNETELSLEAVRVAEKIYNLVYEEKTQIKDGDTVRNIEFGDIAVLMRSPGGQTRRAVTFIETLNRYGIPTISEEKSGFFDAPEIKVMLNVLRVIDNPLQDIPVLSAVMSPMFAFSADTIADIRSSYRYLPIYSAIRKCADKYPVCKSFVDFVDKMRTLAVTVSVDRLVNMIVQSTGYDSVTMALGGQPAKNLFLLCDYARTYAQNGYKTLTSFINYIDRMKENDTKLDSGSELNDESANAVHIKSIHKSKGLEYPVCFLCCTATEFNLQDISGDMILDCDRGVGFRLKDGLLKYDSIQRKALSQIARDNQIYEEIRVLYVALTRAKQRLIVTCVKNDPREYIRKLEAKIPSYPIPPHLILSTKCYADWLFICALAYPGCKIEDQSIASDIVGYDPCEAEWKLSVVEGPYANLSNKKVKLSEIRKNADIDEEFLREFCDRAEYKYPYYELCALPQKVSASELSHKDSGVFDRLLKKPQFLSGSKSDGAERGTAFHMFMERCDIEAAVAEPEAEAQKLADKGFLTERQLGLLDYDRLRSFLSSSLVKRILACDEFYREFTFTTEIDAAGYNPEISAGFSDSKLIMQGAVDLIFVENGEAVVVDYKTDRVKDSNKLADLYHKQVELYKNAVEEILGIPVKEVIIYSVHNNETVSI
ncbi:MAG: helicase-exonuclease AddAB subunit AddA [Ruminococcus sp.]|nr:helicase-exonuclease AddAB subunit AddA [Ruminococcus sp.]